MTEEKWPGGKAPPAELREASSLLGRLIGTPTEENLATIKAFVDASDANRDAFASAIFGTEISADLRARIEKALGHSFRSAHRSAAPVIPIETARAARRSERPHNGARSGFSRKTRLGAASAAALVIAAGVVPYFADMPLFTAGNAEFFRTDHGDIRSFALSDGSNLTLDTDSRVKVTMSRTLRHAELQEGRARVIVKSDPRPFTVEAGSGNVVTSAGTVDVAIDQNRRVDLQLRGGAADLHEKEKGDEGPARMLTMDQTVTYATGAFAPRPVATPVADTRNWPEGWVEYRTIPLAGLIGEANRYARKPIILDDDALAALAVTGRFKLTDTDTFLKRIAELSGLKIARKSDGIHLSRK